MLVYLLLGILCHSLPMFHMHAADHTAKQIPLQRREFNLYNDLLFRNFSSTINPLKRSGVRWLHFVMFIFNFGYSGTLSLTLERQSARMSDIKNVG